MTPIFLHIPKTGGCAISKALGHDPLGHHQSWSGRFQDRVKKANDPLTFTVVRDPVDRAKSLFKFLKSLKTRRDIPSTWTRGTQGVVSEFLQHHSLSGFWECVDVEWIWEQYLFLRPQSWFFRDDDIDYVMRFETLSEDWNHLAKLCERDLPKLSIVNASPKSEETLTNDAEAKIKSIYAIDYLRFF